MSDELEEAIKHDQEHGKWYMHGRAVLGGSDLIHPDRIAGNGKVVCRTGSSEKPLDPEEYLRVRRERTPMRKVGIWDFVPYDDPAAHDVRRAHINPQSTGRELHEVKAERDDLRTRLQRAEELMEEARGFMDDITDVYGPGPDDCKSRIDAFLGEQP